MLVAITSISAGVATSSSSDTSSSHISRAKRTLWLMICLKCVSSVRLRASRSFRSRYRNR